MNKKKIIDYVMNTPWNPNPAVLDSIIEQELPSIEEGDEGKILSVNDNLKPEWKESSCGSSDRIDADTVEELGNGSYYSYTGDVTEYQIATPDVTKVFEGTFMVKGKEEISFTAPEGFIISDGAFVGLETGNTVTFDELSLDEFIYEFDYKILNDEYIRIEKIEQRLKYPNYMFIKLESDDETTVSINVSYSESSPILKYSYDRKNWTTTDSNSFDAAISPENPIVYFDVASNIKGNYVAIFIDNDNADFSIGGKLERLINLDSNLGNSCLTISNLTHLIHASELVMPSDNLYEYAFSMVFYGASNLIDAPELPATTLSNYCYQNMFSGCTSLVNAPELPAMTLASKCYYSMFSDCTSLVNAPELPATTLVEECYENMFSGCTSLVSAPELPATTLADGCYYGMFRGCVSLTTPPSILPAAVLTYNCYNGMFNGCTSLENSPEIYATVLAENSMMYMFSDCYSLKYVKVHFDDWLREEWRYYPTASWMYHVEPSVEDESIFVCPSTLEDIRGDDGIQNGWTRVDLE